MMARALSLALLLLACTAHSDSSASPRSLRRRGREPREHIWGRCAHSRDRYKGCTLESGSTCSDHLSEGPDDADVEIVLRGFPPSTADKPVHVAWWSARRSPTNYEPLHSPRGASVYRSVKDTYPKYYDDDFNGGNVLVSEAGEATIRVRKPSAYNVHHSLGDPHVHLRVCEGENFMRKPSHKVNFGEEETYVRGYHRPHIEVVSAHEFTNRTQPGSDGGSSEPEPEPPMVVGDGTEDPSGPDGPSDPDDNSPRQVLINTARDSPDLDALEFSPVYNCLLDGTFFNHFTAECAEECPVDTAVEHGQCVRQETDDAKADFEVTWKLEIECAVPCWHGRRFATMHNIRLSVADDFDIPFQEVRVSMAFVAFNNRRLADAERREAFLTVRVVSNRLSQEDSADLETFVRDVDFLKDLVGMDVLSVERVPTPDGQFLDEPVRMDEENDPYKPAYTDLEPTPAPAPPSTTLSFLPMPAIIGIAVAVVVVLSVMVGLMFVRRRRAQQNANNQRAEAKAADLDQQNGKDSTAQENNKAVGEEANA